MPLQGNAQIAPPNCAALELAADRLSPLSAASKGQANCTQFSSDFSQVLQSVKDRRASEVENEKREVESDPQLVYLLLTAQPILASAMQNTVQSTPVSHDAASPGASPAVGNTASRAMICAAPSLAPESPSSIESHLAAFASLHSETPSFAGQINAATNSTAEGNAADRRSAIDFSAPAAAGETPANSTIPMPSAPSFDHSEAVFQPSFGNPSTILRQSFDKLRMPQDASGHLGMPVSSFDHPDVVLRQSFDNPSTSSGCLRTPVLIPLQPAAAQHTVPSSPVFSPSLTISPSDVLCRPAPALDPLMLPAAQIAAPDSPDLTNGAGDANHRDWPAGQPDQDKPQLSDQAASDTNHHLGTNHPISEALLPASQQPYQAESQVSNSLPSTRSEWLSVIESAALKQGVNAKQTPTSFRLRLQPAELGPIDLHLITSPSDSGVPGLTVQIEAALPATETLLQRYLDELRQSLRDSGLNPASVSIGQGGLASQSGDRDPGSGRTPFQDDANRRAPLALQSLSASGSGDRGDRGAANHRSGGIQTPTWGVLSQLDVHV